MGRKRHIRSVLFFCRYRVHAAFEKLAGMSAFERRHNRVVRFIHCGPMTQPVEAYIDYWNPVGIISDNVRFRTPPRCRVCPTVFIDVEPDSLRREDVCVQYDSAGAGRLAAEEFIREGFENFAFLGSFEPRYWSDERQRGFVDAISAAGGHVSVYCGERTLADVLAIQEGIVEWMRTLPKPCGVFAANDQAAEYVLGTCRHLGLRVPDEIAVIGVDNDETICENTFESLTSVEPDFREGGRLAAGGLRRTARPSTARGNGMPARPPPTWRANACTTRGRARWSMRSCSGRARTFWCRARKASRRFPGWTAPAWSGAPPRAGCA